MLNATESLETATAQPAQVSGTVTEGKGKSDYPTKIICDLAEANAFCESYGKPHVPIMSTFGAGRLHVCRLQGSWDLDRAAAENPDILFRSIRNLPFKHAKDASKEWDDVTFQFGPRAFVYADKNRVIGFGATPMEAERLVAQFSKTYLKTPAPAGGDFHLIQQDGSEHQLPHCHFIPRHNPRP